MDTKQFLDVVLPAQGLRCVGVPKDGQFHHYFGRSNDWASEAVLRIDGKGFDAYFGCASYKTNASRKATNVEAVRSFWIDIDTQEGKAKEKYADRKVALQDLLLFCRDVHLTNPYVVSSGYGLHAYWPCDEDMTPEAWKQTATLLKKATREWGLAADPSRTSDEASVLRPAGAHNYKRGLCKDVKVVMVGETTSHAAVHMSLEEYVGEDDTLPSGNPPSTAANLNGDLMTKVEYAPSDAMKVARQCGVVREMQDTLGDLDQPTWYRCIGVLAFTDQGEDVCHEWSKGHVSYSKRETRAKYDQARQFAPTTCEKLEECRPDVCAVCPHKGKIKSPITLGTSNGAPEPIPVSMFTGDEEQDAQDAQFAHEFPIGYGWGNCGPEGKEHGLYRVTYEKSEDDAGKTIWTEAKVKFSDVLFYPVNRVRASDGTFSMNIKVLKKGGSEYFMLESGVVMEGGKAMFSELGKREIAVQVKNKPDVTAYLTSWINKLRDEYASSPAVEQFGWVNDGFVVGDTVYTPQGKQRAILTKGTIKRARWLEPEGDLQTWVDLVDQAYNHQGSEAFQFMVLTGLACPLMQLLSPNSGVFVHAYSPDGGEGKSTAQFVAMSAWGQYNKFLLRENEGSSVNAMYLHFGVMNNLPVVIDEMSKCSNEFAGTVAYNASAGQGKRTLTSNREERDELGWSTIFTGSSNRMLSEKIASSRSGATAEMHRIWEFRMPMPRTLPKAVADRLFPQFMKHYGHAGRVFIEYVVNNRDLVSKMLINMRAVFDKKVQTRQDERYWSNLHACVLTALAIGRKLGLVSFDMQALMAWIEQELANNRSMISNSAVDPLEQFSDMVADIFGGFIVTTGEGNLSQQGGAAPVVKHPSRTPITGRYIMPTTLYAEKLYISVAAAKSWCDGQKSSFKEMLDGLVAAGWASATIKRVSLGKGTVEYSSIGGVAKVIDVKPNAIRASTGNTSVSGKITAVISGGQSDGVDGATGSAA